VRISSS